MTRQSTVATAVLQISSTDTMPVRYFASPASASFQRVITRAAARRARPVLRDAIPPDDTANILVPVSMLGAIIIATEKGGFLAQRIAGDSHAVRDLGSTVLSAALGSAVSVALINVASVVYGP